MIWRWLKYLSLVVLLFSTVSAWAGAEDKGTSKRLTTEQLLNHLRSIKNPSFQPMVSDESFQDVKCGFGIQVQVVNRWQEFSQTQRAELSVLMKADSLQCDTVVGHFRIFYDTSATSLYIDNTPALLDQYNNRIPGTAKAYIDSVARIFNHVWDVEITQMGYTPPPFENGQSYYNIYVQDMQDYGVTTPNGSQINGTDVPPRYYSYITIDNDFQENQYYTHGINGLKVTAAHEFHHAIQMGSYGLWANDLYAYELTSTWFEDVVYTDVNDYYNYLPAYFIGFSYGLSFNSSSYGGYERSIFAHCLAKIYGADIMKDIWTGMRTQPFLESTDAALVNHGSNLKSVFAEFTKWNYFTRDRADTVNYYPEGNHYPRFQPLQITDFYNAYSTVHGDVYPLSSSMYEFDSRIDTITAIIANVDIGNAIMGNTTQQMIDVTLSLQSLSQPYIELANGLNAKIAVDNLSLWHSFFIQSSNQIDIPRQELNAAPNPFHLADAPWLKLPINQDAAKTAQVFFFTSSFQLAYSGFLNVGNEDGFRAIVVPTSEVKSKLSSGIYFIIAKTATSDYKWKVAVIR
ncbi:MAG: MXAN_6640 family putative metalloprotease [Bacteroidota bacterium]